MIEQARIHNMLGAYSRKRPVLKYFLQKFGSVYGPKQELSLEEATISWRGRLKFKTYNSRKTAKYGVMVRMVFQYMVIYVTQRYTQRMGTGWGTQFIAFIQKLRSESSHDNFYNTVKLTETLALSALSGQAAYHLTKQQPPFWRKLYSPSADGQKA
jgi:hypothetical protein